MNWLMIIGWIVQFILGRIQPARTQAQDDREIRKIATAIAQLEPKIEFDCLVKVLPDFLRQIGEAIANGALNDYRQIVGIVLDNVTRLVKCQFGMTGQRVDPVAEAELQNRLLKCAINAGMVYFQTRDIAAAISAFVNCVFTAPPADPNPPTNPPTDPGGINPTPPPTFREVGRCR